MKTVCISGHCVSGKSTAVGIMSKHLPNSAIVRSDGFLAAALLYHQNDFEKIYGMPLEAEKPYESLRCILNDSSEESVKKYCRFLGIIAPFLERELETALEEKKHGRDYLLVEYVMLPLFRIWQDADFRIMISSDCELRALKWRERAIRKGTYSEGDRHHYTRESALMDIVESASGIDFVIENRYDVSFEIDLVRLCRELTLR